VIGVPSSLSAGGVATARGLLLLLLHAASTTDDKAVANRSRACMLASFLFVNRGRIKGAALS